MTEAVAAGATCARETRSNPSVRISRPVPAPSRRAGARQSLDASRARPLASRDASARRGSHEAIERTHALLGLPADYRLGIVPASDTGAMEMAIWSMLGARPVTMLAWESFGDGWVTDVVKQLKLDADIRTADYGEICRSERDRSGERRPLHLERHDQRRARARTPTGSRTTATGLSHLRRDLGGVRPGHRLGEDRCRHLQLAEGARRRGGARHAGPRPARGRAARKRAGAAPAAEDLPPDQRRQADRRHLQGRDDQHAVDAGVEDWLFALEWAERVGGLDGADRARRRQCRSARSLGAGSGLDRASRERSGDPLEHVGLPAICRPLGRRGQQGPAEGDRQAARARRTRPTTSPPIATPRRACASGAARRSTPPISKRSGRGSTGRGRQTA